MVVALDAPPATAPSPLKVLLTPVVVVDDSSDDENWKREDEDKSR